MRSKTSCPVTSCLLLPCQPLPSHVASPQTLEFMESRREKLDQYLQALIRDPGIPLASGPLGEFLSPSGRYSAEPGQEADQHGVSNRERCTPANLSPHSSSSVPSCPV